MVIRYLEKRGRISDLPTNIMADVMRHFHARQHLSKAVVVCDDPEAWLQTGHKQWLKLARILQRQRGAASNPIEILKYTYTITQMQHLKFTAKTPREQPEAALYFVRPSDLKTVPGDCLSVYLADGISERDLSSLVAGLPAHGLLVDYGGAVEVGDFGLRPKQEAEDKAAQSWRLMEAFLAAQHIDIRLVVAGVGISDALDDALDILLGIEMEFLSLAGAFQRTLDLARPLRTIPKVQRNQYEMLLVLAHRVQTLSPRGFSPQFLGTYADDVFFLSDHLDPHETLTEAIDRHERAGRWNVVRALVAQAGGGTQHRQLAIAA